jgi:cytochrome oxidase Cu insertion factor (SCO1/SenC/PrrC family)
VAARFADFARLAICAGVAASLALAAAKVRAESDEPQIGSAAPEFAVKDSKGTTRHLSEFRGKPVVLE